MTQEQLITIGKITTTHGHLGEVRVLPLTDFPERFRQLDEVTISLNGQLRQMHVIGVRPHRQFVILKLAEVKDMNAAIELRNALVQIPQSDLVALPEGHYYIFQLLGLKVFATGGDYVGELADVIRTGSNDVYSIRLPNGRELLIPALKSVVREIDLAQQRMVIEPPDDLWE